MGTKLRVDRTLRIIKNVPRDIKVKRKRGVQFFVQNDPLLSRSLVKRLGVGGSCHLATVPGFFRTDRTQGRCMLYLVEANLTEGNQKVCYRPLSRRLLGSFSLLFIIDLIIPVKYEKPIS